MKGAERRSGVSCDPSPVRTHAQSRAGIESPRARVPYTAGCELAPTTPVRAHAQATYSRRSRAAYGQHRSQAGELRLSSGAMFRPAAKLSTAVASVVDTIMQRRIAYRIRNLPHVAATYSRQPGRKQFRPHLSQVVIVRKRTRVGMFASNHLPPESSTRLRRKQNASTLQRI